MKTIMLFFSKVKEKIVQSKVIKVIVISLTLIIAVSILISIYVMRTRGIPLHQLNVADSALQANYTPLMLANTGIRLPAGYKMLDGGISSDQTYRTLIIQPDSNSARSKDVTGFIIIFDHNVPEDKALYVMYIDASSTFKQTMLEEFGIQLVDKKQGIGHTYLYSTGKPDENLLVRLTRFGMPVDGRTSAPTLFVGTVGPQTEQSLVEKLGDQLYAGLNLSINITLVTPTVNSNLESK